MQLRSGRIPRCPVTAYLMAVMVLHPVIWYISKLQWVGATVAESTKVSLSSLTQSAVAKGPGIESRSRCGTCSGVCACVPSLLNKKKKKKQFRTFSPLSKSLKEGRVIILRLYVIVLKTSMRPCAN